MTALQRPRSAFVGAAKKMGTEAKLATNHSQKSLTEKPSSIYGIRMHQPIQPITIQPISIQISKRTIPLDLYST
jgi:hypothetical protein